jgi:hypothetical protein
MTRRRVCPRREERAVPERDLATEADQQVQAGQRDGVQEHHGQLKDLEGGEV